MARTTANINTEARRGVLLQSLNTSLTGAEIVSLSRTGATFGGTFSGAGESWRLDTEISLAH